MKRRDTLKMLSTLGISTLGLPTLLSASSLNRLLQEISFSTEIVRGNVGIFKGRGGTIGWMAAPEGYVVVDTQFPDYAKKLIEVLKEKEDKPISLLFNSHHHGDHSAGNIAFKGIAQKVIAHKNSIANQMRVTKGKEDSQLYPETPFARSWTGRVGKETLSSTYFGAAHTDGDSVVHFENANVAHVGDLVFNRRHPYIDQSSGANIKSWMEVLAGIRAKYDQDTIYICGHAGEGYDITIKAEDIRVAELYFEGLLEVVGKAIKEGKSKEEVLKITKIPGVEWTGGGIERSLTAAYNELKG